MPAILNYLIHLLLAAGLLIVFFIIYTRVTPYNEVLLIRQGNQAAALSLGGAEGVRTAGLNNTTATPGEEQAPPVGGACSGLRQHRRANRAATIE